VAFRWLLLSAVLSLVLVAGGALARGDGNGNAPAPAPAAVHQVVAHVSALPADISGVGHRIADGGSGTGSGPERCVMRADCAGAWVLAGTGLLLAVAVKRPSIGGPALVASAGTAPQRVHAALVASRLFRPPQTA
jgi:hypothetical protein